MIDELTINKIKDACWVGDFMQEDGFKLKKRGVNYFTLCPFHQDRHMGNFVVDGRRDRFKCFSCGAQGNSIDYLVKHRGMTFIEAIGYAADIYGIIIDDDTQREKPKARLKPHVPPPPLPVAYMPYSFVKESMERNGENTLIRWMRSLPWNKEQAERLEKMLKNYKVGTRFSKKHGDEWTVFWYIKPEGDANNEPKVCTAKLMRYKPDGHRMKEDFSTDWLHSAISKSREGTFDDEKWDVDKNCYYGMHMVDFCPDATINIVESEKTAIICATYFGNLKKWLWIACGGKSNLIREKMQPLIDRDRTIILYPDKDGTEEWQKLAKDIKYDKLHINTKFMADNWQPEDGEKADIADVLIRSMMPTEDDLEMLKRQYPLTMGILIDKLDLEIER